MKKFIQNLVNKFLISVFNIKIEDGVIFSYDNVVIENNDKDYLKKIKYKGVEQEKTFTETEIREAIAKLSPPDSESVVIYYPLLFDELGIDYVSEDKLNEIVNSYKENNGVNI